MIIVFVATLFVAVIVDAFSTHSLLRWVASGLVYLATLGTWFWSCWRPSRAREPLQSEAQRFEEADPRLREQLLTAVEFADGPREPLQDSVAFRELLQSQVSHLIAPVDVRHLRWVDLYAGATRGRLRAIVGLTSYSRAICLQLIALIMDTQAQFPADLPIYAYPEPCCR